MYSSRKLPSQLHIFCILLVLLTGFTLFQMKSTPTIQVASCSCTRKNGEQATIEAKLRDSVIFLPLKDLRFSETAMNGNTWFMSSLEDIKEEGGSEYLKFPSNVTKGRVLCLKGRDGSEGSKNSYGLAWRDYLPRDAIWMKGVTYIANSHYPYNNIWHGQSALMSFVGWYMKTKCRKPDRWVLFYRGELKTSAVPWLKTLMDATFDGHFNLETFYRRNSTSDSPTCFEEAVVMRHNEGRLSIDKRHKVYDLMRCKARMHCNVTLKTKLGIGMTLLLRPGSRSFKNSTTVVNIFQKACKKANNCHLSVAYPHNLTFCEQVEIMSKTDILISSHGAQVTNMILMDRNSSVMELFPKGWLEHAGVGQYVFRWLADWSGMRHQGIWRDPVADDCHNSTDIDRCVQASFMERKIGHNESYFMEWAERVIGVMQKDRVKKRASPILCGCELLVDSKYII